MPIPNFDILGLDFFGRTCENEALCFLFIPMTCFGSLKISFVFLLLVGYLWFTWSTLVSITICIVLLWNELEVAVLAGVAVLVVLMPVNGIVMSKLQAFEVSAQLLPRAREEHEDHERMVTSELRTSLGSWGSV